MQYADMLLANREPLTALFSAAAAFLGVVAAAWPYLSSDNLAIRMKNIEGERERIRKREREKLAAAADVTLTKKPPKLYQTIFDGLNLAKQAEDGRAARMLLMAGFRGQAPIVTFLSVRIIAPVILFVIALGYIPVVLKPNLPLPVIVLVAAAIGSLGYFAPGLYVRNRITKRQKSIRRAWPDALDLLLISVEAGMSAESAFRKVAEEIANRSVELAEELSITTAELSYLQDRRAAFDNLATRTGLDVVRAVVTSLIQAERYGTSLGQSLRVLAKEMRDQRMSEAERKAAALPPKLTVPMIVFFLPVLFVIILVPALIQISGLE